MLSFTSLGGIIFSLCVLIYCAYNGRSIIWVAPVCAVIVAVTSGLNVLDAYMVDFIRGLGEYVISWFPAFFLGAVYGKIMDMTGSARSLANKLVSIVGPRFAIISVILPCLLMTYGGISVFVVAFVIYPMGYAIYREANLPRTLLPGAIAFGAFGITMMAIPGTPQIQNIIPSTYYATTAAAAPLMGIVATILMGVPGYLYLEWRCRSARKKGLGFVEDPRHTETVVDMSKQPSWHWVTGLIPLIVVVFMLNVLPNILAEHNVVELTTNQAIVIALLGGIATACLINIKQFKVLLPAIDAGANGSLMAIMNTACAVGFGSVVKSVPGFALLKNALLAMPGSILFSEAVAVNILSGATGSASGGISIALETMSAQYLERALSIGMSPDLLHRVAVLSGGLGTLPHNGAVLTLLAVSNCTHKESYMDICVTACIIPTVVSLLVSFVWGFFI
jgi:H+/gluconate symporter-like permease